LTKFPKSPKFVRFHLKWCLNQVGSSLNAHIHAFNTLEKFTTFGDLLRFLRRRVGITQMELAIAVGYSDTQISRLEQNQRPPDIPTIEARFISALGLENEPRVVERLLDLAANVRREDAPGLGCAPIRD
jgi:DNA-binding XRE family transcriptional regulator